MGFATGSVAADYNTYVPNHEASGKLIVNYSRNVNKFALLRYIQITKVTQDQAYYLAITPDTAGRILNTNLADFVWPDGDYAPLGRGNNAKFNWNLVATQRYAYPFLLGRKAVQQATWPLLAIEAGQMAQLAMTARTLLTANLLFTSSNYDSNHTGTATATGANLGGGGLWTAGTSTNPYIQRSLLYGAQQIQKTTLSAVDPQEMVLVISPSMASAMATSAEIHDYFKGSVFAAAQVRGDVPWLNKVWALPDLLYGFPVVVEDASYVSSQLDAGTTTYSYVLDSIASNDAVLVSRPGGLEGTYGTKSFSTITGFFYEELTVESKDDVDNRLTRGRVVEDYVIVQTAPAATFLFTSCK